MKDTKRGQGVALALVSATGFSTLGLFARLVYGEGFSVLSTLAWRFTFATVFLWILVLAGRRPLPKPLWPVLLLGLLGFAPQAGLYFLTLSYLEPGITSLLLYTYPSFVLILAFVLWRKKPNKVQLLALLLSLAGCVVAFWKRGSYPAIGIFLGVTVGLTYAAYLTAGERVLKGLDSIAATALVMSVAALVYWAAVLATGEARLPTSLRAIVGISGLSILATVIPITTLFASMGRIGAADASLVSTLEPVLTVALSALIIGERLGAPQLAGGALILAAVVTLGIYERRAH
jgi:drug/metabolite transporter (DMT)-like permease